MSFLEIILRILFKNVWIGIFGWGFINGMLRNC